MCRERSGRHSLHHPLEPALTPCPHIANPLWRPICTLSRDMHIHLPHFYYLRIQTSRNPPCTLPLGDAFYFLSSSGAPSPLFEPLPAFPRPYLLHYYNLRFFECLIMTNGAQHGNRGASMREQARVTALSAVDGISKPVFEPHMTSFSSKQVSNMVCPC